jgi:protein-disulfide isomerase
MSRLTQPIGEGDHVQGLSTAPATLLEYGDYECPYCGQVYPIIKSLQRKLATELRFAFRNFPLREAHPLAEVSAEAAEAAGAQGKFWEMHDLIYENQAELSEETLVGHAQRLSLDMDRWLDDMRGQTFAQRIERDFLTGVRSGVNGTPSFFINGVRHDGSFEESELLRAIRAALPRHAPHVRT